MRRRLSIVLFAILILLTGTALTEYLFYRQDEHTWANHFIYRLHAEEEYVDEILKTFRDSVDIDAEKWTEDMVFLGFRNGEIFFWTYEIPGENGLYDQLTANGRFAKLGNTFYEIRRKDYNDVVYFALLRIKDHYPYTNKYVKNKFGGFLKIADDNVDQVEISLYPNSRSHLVKDKDGEGLFYITYGENYKERGSNYLLLSFYLLFFLSLFYVYNLLLKNTSSWKRQLLHGVGFILLLMGIRWFMQTYRLPPTPYRLPIFDQTINRDIFISSVGDLLLTTFCIFEVLYITLANLKVNYQSSLLKRYKYAFAIGVITAVFCYVNFFNFSLGLVVEHLDIHLNVAQLIHVGVGSIVAFIAIIFGGMVILIALYGVTSIFYHLFSFKEMMRITILTCLVLCGLSYVFHWYTNYWDCLFLWTLTFLIAVNRYLVKRDVQRSIYLLAIFLLSVYVVMITKKYEHYKELTQRAGYATDLIIERDFNFEKRLAELNQGILWSGELSSLMDSGDDSAAELLLKNTLLDLLGYNYSAELVFCRPEDRIISPDHEEWNCHLYFQQIIQRFGQLIPGTNFYVINLFDSYVTYIGNFSFPGVELYLRFDAAKEDEGAGYPQILSRKSTNDGNNAYLYSYGKYVDGRLVSSSGNFVYYKQLKSFGKHSHNIEIIEKDDYSHMLIPVNDQDKLVISLPLNSFALYFMNVLYAFLVCMMISSYGLFFNVNQNINFRRGTLKARIKNNIISLVFVLFVILTALNIYINTRSFELRHRNKALELLKYINKELEHLDCIDWRECPEILSTLSKMSELLMIDINIYSENGGLVATSRPEIFQYGFDGYLINPKALKRIQKEGITSYIENEKIGELEYMAAYMPLVLDNGKSYLLNVPYFAQNDELNLDIIIMVVITVNIAIVVMVLAFVLSGLVAERVTKPLQLLNDKLKKMRFGGKNEKISYGQKDEVGRLVQEYNNMVDKLDESIVQLSRSERESAWREMARQIAHEIKNPLTPMKLNIQFMLRSLHMEDTEKFKERFRKLSDMLIEQIDNMASIASAFSDFAKMSEAHHELFDVGVTVSRCAVLFRNSVGRLECEVEPELLIFADREQIRRVLVNLLKNAEQSIVEKESGRIWVAAQRKGRQIEIRIEDNGNGIPEEIREKIFEPNFTTKTSGMGLGLAICRRIVESYGGEIMFETELGKGTVFFVRLDSAVESK